MNTQALSLQESLAFLRAITFYRCWEDEYRLEKKEKAALTRARLKMEDSLSKKYLNRS